MIQRTSTQQRRGGPKRAKQKKVRTTGTKRARRSEFRATVFFPVSWTKQGRRAVSMDTRWIPSGHGSATPGSVLNVYFKSINSSLCWQEWEDSPPPSLHQNYLNLAGAGGIEYWIVWINSKIHIKTSTFPLTPVFWLLISLGYGANSTSWTWGGEGFSVNRFTNLESSVLFRKIFETSVVPIKGTGHTQPWRHGRHAWPGGNLSRKILRRYPRAARRAIPGTCERYLETE